MITDVLVKLRESKGYTMKEVAEGIEIKPDTYRSYERGRLQPNLEIIVKLAKFYKVTTDCILGVESVSNPIEQISDDDMEKSMLTEYFQLPKPVRAQIMEMMYNAAKRTEKLRCKSIEKTQKLTITLRKSRYSVSAGTGYDLNDSDAWDRVNVTDCPEARKADFIVEIDGDSMEPTYHDGDNVFVKSTPDVEIGQIGIFIVDRQGYIKELSDSKLISHNEKYDPIELKGTDNRCVGAVLGIAEIVDD